jgi:hypothetical protein
MCVGGWGCSWAEVEGGASAEGKGGMGQTTERRLLRGLHGPQNVAP